MIENKVEIIIIRMVDIYQTTAFSGMQLPISGFIITVV